jgi:hypothetical protein
MTKMFASVKWSSGFGRLVPVLLFVQAIVAAWFTGAIMRGEQSPYLWVEYGKDLEKFGSADAVLGVALYLLYYAFIVEVPAWFVWRLLMREESRGKKHISLVVGGWVLSTFLLFAASIRGFVASFPTEQWNGWLLIGWGAATMVAGSSIWPLIQSRLKEYQSSYTGRLGIRLERYEDFMTRNGLLDRFFDEEFRGRC